jgi:hypothetical protein
MLHPACHLYQYAYNKFIRGVNCDWTRALQEDYGQASGNGHVSAWPEGMDKDLAQRWYGHQAVGPGVRQFDEAAEECRLWKRLGHFPTLFAVERYEDAPDITREYLRFSDGTIIWRPNDHDHYRVMAPAGPDGSVPEGMDTDLARRWFGRVTAGERTWHFSPNGVVSRRWLESGQFPRLVAVEDEGEARFFVFANGMIIWRPDPGTAPMVFEASADGTLPAGLTEAHAARWFKSAGGFSFDSDDTVRRFWLSLGHFPALAAAERYDDSPGIRRTYLRFADGSVIWRPNDSAAFRLLR